MIKPIQYKTLLKKSKRKPFLLGHNSNFKHVRIHNTFGRMCLSKQQEKYLDTLWSQAVKARASNRCEMCFTSSTLQSHHVIGRRNKTIRHILSNGCCLCAKHHMFAEQNGVAFAEWILKERGQKWFDELQAMSNNVKVYKDFTVIKAYLESFI